MNTWILGVRELQRARSHPNDFFYMKCRVASVIVEKHWTWIQGKKDDHDKKFRRYGDDDVMQVASDHAVPCDIIMTRFVEIAFPQKQHLRGSKLLALRLRIWNLEYIVGEFKYVRCYRERDWKFKIQFLQGRQGEHDEIVKEYYEDEHEMALVDIHTMINNYWYYHTSPQYRNELVRKRHAFLQFYVEREGGILHAFEQKWQEIGEKVDPMEIDGFGSSEWESDEEEDKMVMNQQLTTTSRTTQQEQEDESMELEDDFGD